MIKGTVDPTPRVAATMPRRTVLELAAATGLTAVSAPFVARRGLAAGQVNVFAWGDYAQVFADKFVPTFEKDTGIKVNLSTFGSNDEVENKLRAAGGKGFDIIFPSVTNAPNFYRDELLQPIDESRFNVDAIIPSIYRDTVKLGGVHRGKRYVLPWDWGTEGITIDGDKLKVDDSELSFGTMWEDRPELKKAVALRQKSVIMGVGLYLDAIGQVPSNRMLDVYKTEEDARRVWSACAEFVIARKGNIGAFWNNATEATSAFTDAGCAIGQTWDTTGILLAKEKPNYRYRGPKEGLITWVDGCAIPVGAENVDQAYAFLNFIYTPENGGAFTSATGYNSVVAGFEDHVEPQLAQILRDIYTPAVMEGLWWWQADTPWFTSVRNEFVEKITNA